MAATSKIMFPKCPQMSPKCLQFFVVREGTYINNKKKCLDFGFRPLGLHILLPSHSKSNMIIVHGFILLQKIYIYLCYIYAVVQETPLPA